MNNLAHAAADRAELALHYLGGCEEALRARIEDVAAAAPDRGREVYALIEAMTRFREDAETQIKLIARMTGGSGP